MSPRRSSDPAPPSSAGPAMTSPPPLAPPKGHPGHGAIGVWLADVEPVAGFIASASQADALIKHLSPADLRLIPALPAQGIAMLHAAVWRLRQAGVPPPAPEGTANDAGAGGE